MPDDPSKRGRQDRSRTSKQKHEQAYRRKKRIGGSKKLTGAGTSSRSRAATGGLSRRTGSRTGGTGRRTAMRGAAAGRSRASSARNR
jgi:hypothetical protein